MEDQAATLGGARDSLELRHYSFADCLCLIGLAVLLAAILVPNLKHPHCGSPLTACKSNLKNLATALEMWASDHDGVYPYRLERLVERGYLTCLPTCPATHRASYAYERGRIGQFWSYHMHCCGDAHRRAYSAYSGSSHNYPQYDAERGLTEHP